MNRRDLLRNLLNASLLAPMAASALSRPLLAQVVNPAAGHYAFKLGALDITVVSDGNMVLPANMLGSNQDEADVQEFLRAYYLDPEVNYSHLNHIVIQDGTNTILIDAGDGGRFMPKTSGRMIAGLEAAGIPLESITHVVLTHAHPDHIWGVRDEFDEPFVPNAQYLIGQTEREYWMQEGLVDRVEPSDQQFVLGAVNSIETIMGGHVEVGSDHEVAPNVRMIDTPGHTAGHMSVVVESEGEKLLITGDALHHVIMNFVHPDWTQAVDHDPSQTVATRMALFEMVASEGMMISAYHFPFPGIGHVGKFEDGYRFIPAIWEWDAVT